MGSELEDQIERAADVLLASRYVIALVGAGISRRERHPAVPRQGRALDEARRAADGRLPALPRAIPASHWQQMLARRDVGRRVLAGASGCAGRTRRTSRWRGWSRWACCATQSRRTSTTSISTPAASRSPRSTETARRCAASTAARAGTGREFSVTEVPPACPQCGGIVKGDTVMFGEPIPRAFLSECQSQAERADCVLIAGTSATVYPAAAFPEIVAQRRRRHHRGEHGRDAVQPLRLGCPPRPGGRDAAAPRRGAGSADRGSC